MPVRKTPGRETRPTKHPYFKDLRGFYTSGGKDFVSGKQKMQIFEFLPNVGLALTTDSPSLCCGAAGEHGFGTEGNGGNEGGK